MPMLAVAAAAAWAGSAAAVAMGFAAGSAAFFAASAAVSFLVSGVAGKLLGGDAPSFSAEQTGRLHVVRSAIQSKRIVYGECLTSGVLAYAATTDRTGSGSSTLTHLTASGGALAGDTSLVLSGYDGVSPLSIKSGATFTVAGDATTYTLAADAQYQEGQGIGYPAILTVQFTPALNAAPAAGAQTALTYTVPPTDTGKKNEYLHMVIALAGHEVDSIGEVYFNEFKASDTRFAPGGDASFVHIEKFIGAADQAACATLINAFPGIWTADHRLRGTAYIYVRLRWNADVFPMGIPVVKAVVRGRKVFDPRSPTAPAAWSNNWALCIRDYLTADFGLVCAAGEIDDSAFAAAANDSDAAISLGINVGDPIRVASSQKVTIYADTGSVIHCAINADANWNGASAHGFQTGYIARVDYFQGTNQVPTDYDSNPGAYPGLVIPTYAVTKISDTEFTISKTSATAFAADPSPDVQTLLTIFRPATTADQSQARYTCDGTFDLSQKPKQVLESLLTAGAGMLPYAQGKWRLLSGVYRGLGSTLTLSESDLRGSIKVTPKPSRRDLFNAVRGTFSDPLKLWQPADFPAQSNSAYATDDGGDIVWRDIELPFTADPIRAQRIAKIHLEKSRMAETVEFPAKLSALKLGIGDVVKLSIWLLGYVSREFVVVNWKLSPDGGVDLVLQAENAACYTWASNDAIERLPRTMLSSPFRVELPTNFGLVEQVYVDGAGYHSKVIASWTPSPDGRLRGYEIEASKADIAAWTGAVSVSADATRFEIPNVQKGSYLARIRAVNYLEAKSAWVTVPFIVQGDHPLLSAIGLPSPASVKVDATVEPDGVVRRLRLRATFPNGVGGIAPTGVGLFVAAFPQDNACTITTDNGSRLLISNAHVLASGSTPILAGSTTKSIEITPATQPITDAVNFAGMYWAQFGSSQWRKANGTTSTAVLFSTPFDVAPTTGQTLNWAELAWFDERSPEFRLAAVFDASGNLIEIIRWASVEQDSSGFWLTGVQRGQEGTTQTSLAGKTLRYYAAPGPGTQVANFQTADWKPGTDGWFYADTAHEVNLKGDSYASMSCCLYLTTTNGIIRSALVPVAYGGPL